MLQTSHHRFDFPSPARRGQVLIEFSFIALILYVLLAATIDLGRAAYSAQVVQQAADFMARELAHTPLPATTTFTTPPLTGDVLSDPTVKANIYSEDYLVINISSWMNNSNGQTLLQFLDSMNPPLPSVNRLLVPLMIIDNTKNQLYYPGARVASSTAPSGSTVLIPQVSYSGGTESIQPQSAWLHVVEAITQSGTDLFSVTSSQRGLAAVRVNFPFQAAGLTAFQPNSANIPIQASDPDGTYGPYAGPEGLGTQAAFDQNVRPFRRVISAQAVYRREVFQ